MSPQEIIRYNPESVPAPVGKYSHISIVPKNADLYTFSGQIGIDKDGKIPEAFDAQVKNTFSNIKELLTCQNLAPKNVIKVNVWSVEEIDWAFFNAEWVSLFQESYPSMTIAYIKALGLPEIKIEIEVWAAKT